MLEVNDINVFYGDLQVLWDVSFKVDKGEIVVIIGSNGAGKTTMLKTISGLLTPRSGSIEFLGERIDKQPPPKIVERGISQVPEGRRLFGYMSVLDNLELGAYTKRAREDIHDTLERVLQIFPVLKERGKQLARTLSGGEQQMLAIGRALMSRPELLLLDEPSLGLAPMLVRKTFEQIRELNREGTTVLLIEQNVAESLRLADRAYVLETGRITLEGTGEELLKDDRVKRSYLGI